jgi:outer membrane lipoprotein-sorting protein
MRKFNRHSFIIMSIFCLCLLLQGQRAAAQVASGSRAPKPEELLDRMRQALDALGAAEFTFEFRAENGAGDLLGEESGRFIAQGECFRLEGSVLTVYCDGVSKWIYDEGAQEITVFPHDTASTDPAENPFAVLRRADPGDYTFRGAVRRVNGPDGQAAWLLVMASKDRNAAYTLIEFTVSQRTLLPVKIVYESRNGDRYDLSVLSVKGLGELPGTEFTAPESLMEDPDIYITDLR